MEVLSGGRLHPHGYLDEELYMYIHIVQRWMPVFMW